MDQNIKKDCPLVSVVIPVYNVENYLAEAVDSVLRQTYHNVEIVLVDDGSTDASGRICDEYAERFESIRVYHTDNYGPSHARNVGLSHIRGEWVAFLDSDDWIADHTIETFLKYSADADVIVCGMEEIPSKVCYHYVNQATYYPSFRDAARDLVPLHCRGMFDSASTKLYRVDSIHSRFDESLRHVEDLIFNLEYLPMCHGIRIIPDLLYKYRVIGEPTVSKRFWVDQYDISKRTLLSVRESLAGIPEAVRFFERRFAIEACIYFVRLVHIKNITKEQKIMILELRLEDEMFQDPAVRRVCLNENLQKLWSVCKTGDAGAIYAFYTEQGLQLLT